MKQRKRIYYNAQQRAVIWDRYQQGDSLHDIAKTFDRMHSSIQGLIARTGGIKPPDKTRAASHLTSQEREEIYCLQRISERLIKKRPGLAIKYADY